ncbi:MAG: helicase [Betaproteobacteria bacterium]|nr:helicase [Betaproteobacteria bacterium]
MRVNGHDRTAEPDRAMSALLATPCPADRDAWWRLVASAKAAGLDEDVIRTWSANGPNFNDRDFGDTYRSLNAEGGYTERTLFQAARAAGWRDDQRRAASADLQAAAAAAKPAASAPEQSTLSIDIANRAWSRYAPATAAQSYIKSKLGQPDGLRVTGDGALAVPLFTLDGELVAVQTIGAAKRFLKDTRPGQFPDACFVVGGPLPDAGVIYITEGIGQGWSAHQATRLPAAVAFGVGRIAGVAAALRERFPQVQLVLVADVGKENQMAAIAHEISGAWIEPPASLGRNGDINDLHQRDGLQAVAELLAKPKKVASRYKLLTPADLGALEPIHWRIKRVMPKSGIGSIYGASTAGKSFIALDLAGACSRGVDWHGYKTHACPVTYIAAEGEAGVAQRVQAYEQSHGSLPNTFRAVTTALDILSQADRIDLVQAIRAAGQIEGIVIFDTLNRAAPGIDENDSADMGDVVTALKWLQSEIGGLVLVIHHTGKDASRGPRGHSSLFAALDFGLEVRRDGDRRNWINRKTRDGEDGKEHPFRLKVVDVGIDEDGDPLTSCVIEQEEDPAKALRAVKLPSGGNQRIVWDALGEMLRQPAALFAAGAPSDLPAGRPALRLEDAAAKLRGRLPEVEPKRQKERINEAITGLINRGALVLREGWIWCA